MGNRFIGFVLGSVAAATYGLNPLFALPLSESGMDVDSILFYRYLLAILILGVYMHYKHHSFALTKKELFPLIGVGLLFSCSSLFLFQSYNFMDSGIASTVLFVYPVMVAVIMMLFFHERLSLLTASSIALALLGISFLYKNDQGEALNMLGVTFVFLSALSYAIYMVWINHSVLKEMPVLKLTFYALLFGFSIYLVRLRGGMDLQPVATPALWMNVLSLAIFPTIVSLLTMTRAIHYIGSTAAAILGALEPLTALFFGILVFGEEMTPRIAVGVLFILGGVILLIAGKPITGYLHRRVVHVLHR